MLYGFRSVHQIKIIQSCLKYLQLFAKLAGSGQTLTKILLCGMYGISIIHLVYIEWVTLTLTLYK